MRPRTNATRSVPSAGKAPAAPCSRLGILQATIRILCPAALLALASASQGAPVRSLYADPKASQVGDLVTILVVESTQASRSASTESNKVDSLGLRGDLDTKASAGRAVATGTTSASHNGTGTTRSRGALTTTVTAVVTEVLPNGYLRVQGSRELTINEETEVLTVEGTCRVDDIRTNNTIFSHQLANARIRYTGKGWIAKQQKPNIILRILAGILPFF
jgi:flagellar L-ring protein precursor FlgH